METRTKLPRWGTLLLLALVGCDTGPLDTYPAPTFGIWEPPPCRLHLFGQGEMPLQKAHLSIPLGGGLQSNIAERVLGPGKVVELENARQTRVGQIVKRTGTAALGTGLLGTADTLPPSWALGTLKGCLVSLSGAAVDHPVNAWSPTVGQWATDAANGGLTTSRRGPVMATKARLSSIGRGADIAFSSGYYFVTWWQPLSTGVDIYQAGFDATSGAQLFLVKRTLTVGAPRALNVAVVNGYAVFVRDSDAAAADIVFDVWQLSNLDAGATSTTFATTTTLAAPFSDMRVKDSTTVQIAFVQNTPRVEGVDFVPSTATATGWVLNDATAAAVNADLALGWMQDFGGSGKIALITASVAQGVRVQWDIPTSGATRQAASTYTMDAAPTVPLTHVTGHTRTSAATGEFTVLYDNTNGADSRIQHAQRASGVISASVLYRSVAIQSKTWQQGGDWYVMARRLSPTQGTRFVLRVPYTGAPAPTAILSVNGGDAGLDRIGSVVNSATNTYLTPIMTVIRLSGNPAAYSPVETGIDLITMRHLQPGDTTTGAPREAMDSLLVPGGALGQFDGTTYAEAGFAYYPEQATVPAPAGANTYFYSLVYSYADQSGRLWRSAPSIPKQHTQVAVISGGATVTVGCPTLRLTGRNGVTIEVYRTAQGASATGTFQKVGTVANDTTVDSVNFVDGATDATQATGEFLYTNGGVLANDAIPGFSAIAIAGNRLFGISNDEPDVVWVSNRFVPGQGLRFSEQNKILVRDQRGPLYALGAQPDGSVIAIKREGAYVISGDGPDAAGRGSFSVQLIAADVGTINPRSIAETSSGTAFQSTSGRLMRMLISFSIEYFGDEVQEFLSTASPIVGTAILPARREMRFYMASNKAVVYDLITGMWSIDSLTGATAATTACAWGDLGAYYDGTIAAVVVDDAAVYTDRGNNYTYAVTTPWLQLNDVRGYERFYRLQGVGRQLAAHTLTVKLSRDYNGGTVFSTQTVSPGSLWDWEMRYSAKLAALRVRMEITSSNAAAEIEALVVEYGQKQGLGRRASRTA